jgi:peroxiredoxin
MLAGVITVVLVATLGYFWLAPAGLESSPDITVFTIDGEELALANLLGKPLLVTFWATSCHLCVREIPRLIQLYKELSPQGLEIIAIAMYHDPPNRVLAMRKARGIPYTIALDIHADAARAFGNVRLTPSSFLIAPDGRVVYRKTGEMNMDLLRQDILSLLEKSQTTRDMAGNNTS